MKKKISWWVIVTGAIVGLSAVLLTHFGNPANMGFCIACFLRDIAGSLGLHSAGKVQYIRPEIIGLVLGAFVMSVCTKEFRAKSGSAPALRFVLGAFVMIGALASPPARRSTMRSGQPRKASAPIMTNAPRTKRSAGAVPEEGLLTQALL